MGLPLRGPKVKSKHLKLLNLCKICKCPLHPPAPPIEHASVQLYDYNNNTIQFEPGRCNAHGSNLPKEVGVHSTKVLAGLYARDTSSHSPEGGTVNTAE